MTDEQRPLRMTEEEIYADFERMAQQQTTLDRREFLKRAAGSALALLSASTLSSLLPDRAEAQQPAPPVKKSRVVLVRHSKIRAEGRRLNPDVLAEVMQTGMCALTGAKTLEESWKHILKPTDRLAVKWNELGGPGIVTFEQLKEAVKQGAKTTGITEASILMWGTPPDGNIPEQAKGVGPVHTFPNGMSTRVTNALEQWATALVCLPVVKMHWGAQMSISMKLHFGSIDNPGTLHGTNQAPMWQNIVYLNAIECIRKKTRLIIADAVRPQWKDGPGDRPPFRWYENALLFSTDFVAIDAVGCSMLEKKRQEVGEGLADDARRTIALAQELGLGNATKGGIDFQEINLG